MKVFHNIKNTVSIFTKKQILVAVCLTLLLLFLDILIKQIVLNNMSLYQSINIAPFFDILFIVNKGVSFSFLQGLNPLLLLLLSATSLFLILYLVLSGLKIINWEVVIFIAFLVAGGLGNMIDRAVYGGVIDYLHLYYGRYSFPVFNLADIFITFSAIIIIKEFIWNNKK